ncbi:30S ribosomal protein S16 [Patescibacteria group bacterium]|nr:MAG: 30S ribosomal protein S16 [Patescibacteria group bacterium]
MLVIRFNRTGKNKRASYRIMVQEHTVAPGGRHVEIVGSHDPHLKKTVLKTDRIKYWISQGAQPSDTVYNLLVQEKVIEGKKREVKIPRPVPAEVAPEAAVEVALPEVAAPAEVASEAAPAEVAAPVEVAPAAEVEKQA